MAHKVCLTLLLALSAHFAMAQSIEPQPSRLRFSFEQLPLPHLNDEVMGLGGAFFDVLNNEHGGYWGVGGYGAATGDRGGMFTVGLTAGWHHQYQQLHSEVGLFVGAGGGASAFVGHGFFNAVKIMSVHDGVERFVNKGRFTTARYASNPYHFS